MTRRAYRPCSHPPPLFGIFPDQIAVSLNTLSPEKPHGDPVKMCRDLPEVLVQIQCAGTDLIPSQIEQTVRRDGLLRLRINQHSGDGSGMRHILIFHIGIDLIRLLQTKNIRQNIPCNHKANT